jgi:two-component system response regulator AtoC
MAATAQQSPYEIIGAHPSIIEVLKQVALVADSHVPVLIQGETGTGKELVARALHNACSPSAPFIAVNCSAVVATLLESELFGHAKGAFTGADSNKIGKLEAAGNGTIFFDEIGDMSYDLQAKLLRVLQEKEFERVGSTNPIAFHARVVAATHRDLQLLVAGNEFREDLYYRLAVSTIRVPSLRDRRTDIPALVQSILERITQELHKDIDGFEEGALQCFMGYDWPGNIRELSNVVTRAILLARTPVISKEVALVSMGQVQPASVFSEGIKPLRDAERDYVLKALISTGWNIMRTAALLDISRVTLRKKIEDYGLSKSSLEN